MKTKNNIGWLSGLPEGMTVRREAPGDLAFARSIYGANRLAELALLLWPRAAKDAFLDQQFAAQQAHFTQAFARADRLVVERQGTPMGRLYVLRQQRRWQLIEIGLLPDAQRQGVGSALITALQKAARTAGASAIELQVAHDNARAAALYVRLGFEVDGAPSPTHQPMIWHAATN